MRLHGELRASRNALLLLAGFLIPEDAGKWSEKLAEQTADFLGDLSEEHMPALDQAILEVTIGFLESMLRSELRFPTASLAHREAVTLERSA